MRDKEDQNQQNPNNVLEMVKWRQERTNTSESSIGSLVDHMRKVRELVPVNERLKEELRQKMFHPESVSGELSVGQNNLNAALKESKTGLINKLLTKWYGLAAVLAAVLCLLWVFQGGNAKKLEAMGEVQEVARYWSEKEVLQPVVSPDGNKLLLTRSNLLIMLDQDGVQRVLLKPEQDEKYIYPAWTSDGNKITLVRKTKEKNEEIIQYEAAFLNRGMDPESVVEQKNIAENLSGQKPEILYQGQAGEEIAKLHWSPVGNRLAFIVKKDQQASVILLDQEKKPHNLGAGTDLTWSPDGSGLVVERKQNTPQLWITDLNRQAELLVQGENPVWSQQGYLVFTDMKAQERILTYMPDGSPQFTVQQKVGEIRSVYLGKSVAALLGQAHDKKLVGQSNRLINMNNTSSLAELKWLRDLTAAGVREPRVLILDDVEKNSSQCFGPQGKTLYLTRTEGETVSVMRAELRESFSLK